MPLKLVIINQEASKKYRAADWCVSSDGCGLKKTTSKKEKKKAE